MRQVIIADFGKFGRKVWCAKVVRLNWGFLTINIKIVWRMPHISKIRAMESIA